MRIPQLSLVIANKPGHLIAPCKLLAEAGINLVTLALADQRESGILRLIVRDWQRAREVLEARGLAVTVTEVLAIEVRDQPGGLVGLLEIFERAGINVEYMYAFTERLGDCAVMVFCFNDLDAAIFALTGAGINPVSRVTLYECLDEES
jgi:hypothetical protein